MKIKSKKKSEKCLEKKILAGDFHISTNKWKKCSNNSLYFQCCAGMQCSAFSVSHMVTWKMRRQWEGESLLQLGAAAGGGTVWMQFWNGCRNCSSEWMHCSLTAPRRSSAHSLERKSLLPAAHSKFLRALLKWNNEGCPEQTWRGGAFFFPEKRGIMGRFLHRGRHPGAHPVSWAPAPPAGSSLSPGSPLQLLLPYFRGRSSRTRHLQQGPSPDLPIPLSRDCSRPGSVPPLWWAQLLPGLSLLLGACSWGRAGLPTWGCSSPARVCSGEGIKALYSCSSTTMQPPEGNGLGGGFFSACQAPRWGSRGGIAVGAAVCALHWVVATPESHPALGSISLDISACYSQPYSSNHRITAWFVLEQTWKIIPAPATGRDTFHKTRLLRACPWTLPGILRSQNTTQPWAGIHPQNGLKWNAAIKQCPLAKATVSLHDLKHQNANLQYSK